MKQRRPFRLYVEELESRLVPSTVAPPATPPAPYALWGSSNWSGIDLDTTTKAVTSVSGSWIVPAVTGSGTGYSSTWVGIDGDLSSTVEQIGTESDTAATAKHDGTPQYYAWYEMYPAGSYFTTPYTVTPGDEITASVVYAGQVKSGSKTNDTFTLSISDSTGSVLNWSYSTTQDVPTHVIAQRDSAEWIEEAPSGNSVLPLANFGSVTFTNAQATIGGATGSISSFVGDSFIDNYGSASTPLEINVMDMGTFNRAGSWTSIKDETSLLNAAGNSFTVQFGASNPAAPSGVPKMGPDDRVADPMESAASSFDSGAVASSFPLIPDGVSTRGTTIVNPFLASDMKQPGFDFASVPAMQVHSMDQTEPSAVSPTQAGFCVAACELSPAISPQTTSTGALTPHHSGLVVQTMELRPTQTLGPAAAPSARLESKDCQLYTITEPSDRSMIALVLVVSLHGWNRTWTSQPAQKRERKREMTHKE
jgi:hypothetical protein